MNYLFWVLLLFVILDMLVSLAILRFWYLQEKRQVRRELYELDLLRFQYDCLPLAELKLKLEQQNVDKSIQAKGGK